MWEPDYVTRDQFKNYVRIELNDTADDEFIDLDITAASRAIDQCCSDLPNGLGARRQFGNTAAPEARYYTPRWDEDQIRWVVEIDDLDPTYSAGITISVDTSNEDNFDQTVTAYVLRPRNAAARSRVYTQISILSGDSNQPTFYEDSVKVTSRWGWAAVPDVVVRATLIQAHRFNKRRTAPFGVSGSSNNSSEVSKTTNVDPDIEKMLKANDLVKLGWTV